MTTVLFTEKSIERLQKIVSSATMMTGASYISSLLLTTSRIPRLINDGIHTITFQAMMGTCKVTPKGKETQYSEGGVIRMAGRQELKVGRMVRSILIEEHGYELTDSQIEDFVNTIRVTMLSGDGAVNYEFVMVKGDDITKYYRYQTYATGEHEGCGTLWNSCMRSGDRSWFDVYSKNDNCEMLLQVQPNKVNGDYRVLSRALVWKTKEGITLMDRVYSVKDEYFAAMRQYAIDKGWHHKHRNSSDSERMIVSPSGDIDNKMKVSVETGLDGNYGLEHFPYMDTFKYFDYNTGVLTNYPACERPYILQETCGGYSSHNPYALCQISNEYTHPENLQTLGTLSRMAGAKVHTYYCVYAICGFNIDGSKYCQYLLEDEVELSAVGSVGFKKGILDDKLMNPVLFLKMKPRDGYLSMIDLYGHSYSGMDNGVKRYHVCWNRNEVFVTGGVEIPESIQNCLGKDYKSFEDMCDILTQRRIIQKLLPALQASGIPIYDCGVLVTKELKTEDDVAGIVIAKPTARRSVRSRIEGIDEIPF